jgi:hypothetical protein
MLELKVPRSLAPTAFHTASNRPPTACTGPRKRSLAPLELPPNPPFPFKQIPGEGVRGQPNGQPPPVSNLQPCVNYSGRRDRIIRAYFNSVRNVVQLHNAWFLYNSANYMEAWRHLL